MKNYKTFIEEACEFIENGTLASIVSYLRENKKMKWSNKLRDLFIKFHAELSAKSKLKREAG